VIVLDACAAIEWLLQTSTGQRVEQQIFSQSESLHATHLLDVEIIEVLRRLVRKRVVSVPRADQAITDLLDLRINRYPHFVLLPRIWQLHHNPVEGVVELGLRKSFKIVSPGSSLRRRVAYSLAIVRLILVPVILLAVYYLFRMGLIVDRIVSVDAPVARLAEQVSVEILNARRAERNYFLLRDPEYLKVNRESLTRVTEALGKIRDLEPGERTATQQALENATLYGRQFSDAVSQAEKPGGTPIERTQEVVRAYERDLNDLLKQARRKTRTQLIDDLRSQVNSFDVQIAKTLEAVDPTLRRVTPGLQASSQQVLQLASELESRSWARVQQDHEDARYLLYRAEWVLSIVSGLTLLLSIWISLVLPRQVVKPLLDLREAVDHAASGNYQIDFELRGEGEVVELAKSVHNLIAHALDVTSRAAPQRS
jgi:CHASE3 domain sensor protein